MMLLSHFVEFAMLKVTGERPNKNGKIPGRMKKADQITRNVGE